MKLGNYIRSNWIEGDGGSNPGIPFKKGDDIPKGIVKWYVEILDETDEPNVGVATILTMIRKKNKTQERQKFYKRN